VHIGIQARGKDVAGDKKLLKAAFSHRYCPAMIL
jgi:hypothetical protein